MNEVSERFDAPEDAARLTSMVDVAMAIALLHHQSGDAGAHRVPALADSRSRSSRILAEGRRRLRRAA